ncbi:nickel/cobalt transporter [Amorphus sp. 3PC139-8]|uniref:nickel/cobalt transporter n=1 Tax=Amorphus sp. 3PC139-8 TaxID=2735676 RepID=UPI00345DFB2C
MCRRLERFQAKWKPVGRPALLATLAVAAATLAIAGPALAAGGPFGVGAPEPMAPVTSGPLAPVFAWVTAWQSSFYRTLTTAISEMKANGTAPWLLIALSFAYGVFHAVGPGHGKAVVSSYVMANEATARRAIGLSFAASAVQATTAVVLVLVAASILNLSSLAMSRSIETIEVGAYALVTLLGATLIWRKILRPLLRRRQAAPHMVEAASLSAATSLASDRHGHAHHHDHAHHHHTAEAAAACGCGHVHMIGPELLEKAGSRREIAAAILSIGLRPCTGAVIVLVFALAQGLPAAGIVSAYVMGIGTAVTVSTLALLAVGAKGLAVRLSGTGSALAERVHAGFEAAGAMLVFALGLLLLGASLASL